MAARVVSICRHATGHLALVKTIGSMLATQSLEQVGGNKDDICYSSGRLVPTEIATYIAQADLMVHQFYGFKATRSDVKNILPLSLLIPF